MKKIIIALVIILTSGLAAFALTVNKGSSDLSAKPSQLEISKIQSHAGDTQGNLANAD